MISRIQQKFSVWLIGSCPIAFKGIPPKDPDDDDDESDEDEEDEPAVIREPDE